MRHHGERVEYGESIVARRYEVVALRHERQSVEYRIDAFPYSEKILAYSLVEVFLFDFGRFLVERLFVELADYLVETVGNGRERVERRNCGVACGGGIGGYRAHTVVDGGNAVAYHREVVVGNGDVARELIYILADRRNVGGKIGHAVVERDDTVGNRRDRIEHSRRAVFDDRNIVGQCGERLHARGELVEIRVYLSVGFCVGGIALRCLSRLLLSRKLCFRTLTKERHVVDELDPVIGRRVDVDCGEIGKSRKVVAKLLHRVGELSAANCVGDQYKRVFYRLRVGQKQLRIVEDIGLDISDSGHAVAYRLRVGKYRLRVVEYIRLDVADNEYAVFYRLRVREYVSARRFDSVVGAACFGHPVDYVGLRLDKRGGKILVQLVELRVDLGQQRVELLGKVERCGDIEYIGMKLFYLVEHVAVIAHTRADELEVLRHLELVLVGKPLCGRLCGLGYTLGNIDQLGRYLEVVGAQFFQHVGNVDRAERFLVVHRTVGIFGICDYCRKRYLELVYRIEDIRSAVAVEHGNGVFRLFRDDVLALLFFLGLAIGLRTARIERLVEHRLDLGELGEYRLFARFVDGLIRRGRLHKHKVDDVAYRELAKLGDHTADSGLVALLLEQCVGYLGKKLVVLFFAAVALRSVALRQKLGELLSQLIERRVLHSFADTYELLRAVAHLRRNGRALAGKERRGIGKIGTVEFLRGQTLDERVDRVDKVDSVLLAAVGKRFAVVVNYMQLIAERQSGRLDVDSDLLELADKIQQRLCALDCVLGRCAEHALDVIELTQKLARRNIERAVVQYDGRGLLAAERRTKSGNIRTELFNCFGVEPVGGLRRFLHRLHSRFEIVGGGHSLQLFLELGYLVLDTAVAVLGRTEYGLVYRKELVEIERRSAALKSCRRRVLRRRKLTLRAFRVF